MERWVNRLMISCIYVAGLNWVWVFKDGGVGDWIFAILGVGLLVVALYDGKLFEPEHE